MALLQTSIGLDAATRAKYQNNFLAKFSIFSITQTDDSIPRANFTLSVYYVIGALASILYAMIDSSCEDLTAYQTNVLIDDCPSILATFSCRTADYDRTAVTGYIRSFDTYTCLDGKQMTEESLGAHSPSLCSEFKEAAFECKTADYDGGTGVGIMHSFTSFTCPMEADTANIPVYSDLYPPSTCLSIQEDIFACRTADYDENAGNGKLRTFVAGTCPFAADTAITYVYSDSYPATTCASIQEPTFTCRTADYDNTTTPMTGWEQHFTSDTCPTDESGNGDLYSDSYLPSDCASIQKATSKCRTTDYDTTTTPVAGWEQTFDSDDCPTTGSGNGDVFGWHAAPSCGNLTEHTMTCRTASSGAATGQTACACPENLQTSVDVTRDTCDQTIAVDYNTCGRACGKTYDQSNSTWDSGNDDGEFSDITGAVTSTSDVTHYTYHECHGTLPNASVTFTACAGTLDVPIEFDTCSGTRDAPVVFDTCAGMRNVPVVFDTCEGTVETDVSYAVCDGFVTICPETVMSVRLSQARAYAATWMSFLAVVYNNLASRELVSNTAERVEKTEERLQTLEEKNDIVDENKGPVEGDTRSKDKWKKNTKPFSLRGESNDVVVNVNIREGANDRV